MIKSGSWAKNSGKLPNPGKSFFFKLADDTIRDVNLARDADGIIYVRKAMIRCGMSLNLNGRWDVEQLFPRLQEIVNMYGDDFHRIG